MALEDFLSLCVCVFVCENVFIVLCLVYLQQAHGILSVN